MPRQIRKVRTLSSNKNLVRQQRAKIIQAAFSIFSQKGYDGTSIREIAAQSGMTAGNIYRYIGSKEDILHLLCRLGYDSTERLVKEFKTNMKPDDKIVDTLQKTISNYIKWSDEWADAFLFYDRNVQSLSSEDQTLVRNTWITVVDFFEQLIRKGNERQEFQVKSPNLFAHNIASLGHDWALRKWYLIKHYTIIKFIDEQIDILYLPPVVNKRMKSTKEV